MTYYHEQVLKIRANLYPKDYQARQIRLSKLFIDQHFSTNIRVDDMAGAALFSKFHFIRLFMKYYGRTPHQYLTEVRVAQAKQLLQTHMTISAVCFSVGYDSVTSFSGLFKKMTGTTPSAFQDKKLGSTQKQF